MARLVRAHDWDPTPLGPIGDWPGTLKAAADFIFSCSLPAVVLWGQDLLQIYNDGYRDLMGAKHPRGLGQPTRECWPEAWHIRRPILDRVWAGEAVSFEDKLIPLDRRGVQEDAWFTLSYSPLRHADGAVAGILVIVIEVTARHRAETALRTSEARFRAFVTARSDVVYRMSADWSEMCRLDGRGFLSDTIEPTGTWMDRYIYPGDQPTVRAAVARAVRTGGVFELEHRVRQADGAVGWVLSRAVPVRDEAGAVIEWLGSAHDITARRRDEAVLRESEARAHRLVNGIALAVWEADPTGAVITDSPSWCAFTGQSSAEWLGTGWLDAVHPDDRDRTIRLWRRATETRRAVDTEYRLRMAGGGWRWVGVRTAPVFDAGGELQKWVGMNVDVHERRQAEERLREAEVRGAFLLALSDALRPLTDPAAIESTACTLLGEHLGAERCYYIELDEAAGVARVGQDYRRPGLSSFVGEHALLFIGWCLPPLREDRPLVVEDALADALIPEADRPALGAAGLVSFASTPLIKAERLVGAFSVTAGARRAWTDAEIGLLRETGERVWEAVERARTQALLRQSEERFRGFADASNDVLWIADAGSERVEYVSPAAQRVFGVPSKTAMAGSAAMVTLIHPEDRAAFLAIRGDALKDESTIAYYRVMQPDGSVVHARDTSFLIRDHRGVPVQVGSVVQDISDIEAARAALEAEKERFRSLAEGIPSLVWRAAADGRFTWASPQWLGFTGQTQEQSTGFGWLAAVHPEDRPAAVGAWQAARERGVLEVEHRVRQARDGRYLWHRTRSTPVRDEHGGILEWLGTTTDIQDLKALQERLLHTALHDGLTGLHSRAFLTDRLTSILAGRQGGGGGRSAVLFLDLDRFKMVNDGLGHPAGDELLIEIGRRLRACTRACDTVARFGGDEFALVIDDAAEPGAAVEVAERIIGAVRRPVRLGQQDVYTACSLGIVHLDAAYATAAEVLRDADIAMYHAKRGGGGYALFSESMRNGAVEAFDLRTDLRAAITRREFVLHYQAICDVTAGTTAGVEALLRWNHPQRGPVPPSAFIPAAEESGLIREIGTWVLNEACGQLRAWCDRFPGLRLCLSVNASGAELNNPGYAPEVQKALLASGIDPRMLQIEVTESVFLHQSTVVGETLCELRALGVRVALDDFGTGYSSLGYLDSYRIDTIKIDRSFVAGLRLRPNAAAVVQAIVGLGQAMSLSVVAEGVETEEQLQAVRGTGCKLVQGYLLGRPMSSRDMSGVLAIEAGRRSDG